MIFDLTGKTALVTGSTQGIGKAVAKALSDAGARVFLHCTSDISKARAVCSETGGTGAVTADLSDIEQARGLFEKTGPVDILVLNASVQIRCPWEKINHEDFIRQVSVNFESTLALMQSYYPGMKEKGFGRIITVGSVQQTAPHPEMAVYAATKCAVLSLVRNIAKQAAPYGVTVNNIAPGVIATPRNEAALSDEIYRYKVMASIPAGFVGEPEDIAGAVLLLASEQGRYITGADIPVCGGKDLL